MLSVLHGSFFWFGFAVGRRVDTSELHPGWCGRTMDGIWLSRSASTKTKVVTQNRVLRSEDAPHLLEQLPLLAD